MATNDFKAFGIAAGANVTSQSDYESLDALLTGFQSGKASSSQINKALRQSTVMAAILAQFISDSANVDVFDNGNLANILANLKLSINNLSQGRITRSILLTATGAYTPSPGTKKIKVTVIGGGGGGGGAQACASGYVAAGSGGGAGGSVTRTIVLSSSDPISFTVGKGGIAGNYTQNQPSDGGASSFGSILYASGGARGNNCPAIPFGNTQLISNGGGGVGSGGDINSIGGSGGQAVILATGYTSGGGGNSELSGGGQPIATTNSSAGIDGRYGSGASGGFVVAGDSSRNGGRGGDGVIYIEEYA